jgi:hypothetical protein
MSISPEVLQTLELKLKEYAIPRNSWDGYAALLQYVDGALQRIPTQGELEATDAEEIDRLFTVEMMYLAATVGEIFEGEGLEELANYLYEPIQVSCK